MADDQERDFWGKTPADYAASKAGNAMLVRHRDAAAGRPIGQLNGATQPPEVAERLARAVTDAEAAHRSGHGVDAAEEALTEALNAARLDREIREGRRDPETGEYTAAANASVDFGGGYRRHPNQRARPNPGLGSPSANQLFRQLIDTSREEAREANRGLVHEDGIAIGNR